MRDIDADAWTIWMFTDTVGSRKIAKESPERLEKHLGKLQRIVISELPRQSKPAADGVKATFIEPWRAIQAALRISGLDDGLEDRIGLDIESGRRMLEEKYEIGAIPAIGLMELCPGGYILLSETVVKHLTDAQKAQLELDGPIFVKLRGIARPLPAYAVAGMPGKVFPVRFVLWQTPEGLMPGWRSPWSQLRVEGPRRPVAELLTYPFWPGRDLGLYPAADFGFAILNCVGRGLQWKELELFASIGRADVKMCAGWEGDARHWASRVGELADSIGNELDQAMATYQLAHVCAHFEQSESVAQSLEQAYQEFEKMAECRMGGWAAMYLGRCLRRLERFPEAEDWILAGILILTSGRKIHRRGIAYALTQMARLRDAEEQVGAVQWYLEKARQFSRWAVDCAPDDTPGERRLRAIESRARDMSEERKLVIHDPAREIVEAILTRAKGEGKY